MIVTWMAIVGVAGALILLIALGLAAIKAKAAELYAAKRFAEHRRMPRLNGPSVQFRAIVAEEGCPTAPATIWLDCDRLVWSAPLAKGWLSCDVAGIAGSDVQARQLEPRGKKCHVVIVDAWCQPHMSERVEDQEREEEEGEGKEEKALSLEDGTERKSDSSLTTGDGWRGDMMALFAAQVSRLSKAVTLGGEATQRRIRTRLEFAFVPEEKCNSSASARLEALRFHRLILLCCGASDAGRDCALAQAQASSSFIPEEPRIREVLLLVNPVAGNKNGAQLLESLKPMIAAASKLVHFTIANTTHFNHARELARELNPGAFDSVVVLGGDGMLFEVLNGILDQQGGAELLGQLSLGVLPAGTGNGLSASLNIVGPEDAMLRVLHGRTRKVDVMQVHQRGNNELGTVYGLLQVSCGMMPDVDFESEVVRWMGDLRFTLVAIYRWIFLRNYPVKLSCKLVHRKIVEGGKARLEAIDVDDPRDCQLEMDENIVFLGAMNTKSFAEDFISAPFAHVDDGLLTLINFPSGGKVRLFQGFFQMASGSHVDNSWLQMCTTRELTLSVSRCPGVPTRLDIDGEEVPIIPDCPVTIRLLPSFCSVLC